MRFGASLWPVALCGSTCPAGESSALSVKHLNVQQPISESPDTHTPVSLVRHKDYDGWKNPEDYAPMPSCAYYVDNGAAWLEMMANCTSKRCVFNAFGICLHHEWLTEQSCLEDNATPKLLEPYYDNCERSPLGKALLYEWLGNTLGLNWQSPPGDVLTAEHPATNEMTMGYEHSSVTSYAPWCLLGMHLDKHSESFSSAIGVCSFEQTTGDISTGASSPNGRDWAYDDGKMVTTEFQIPGYDIFGDGRVGKGQWFDKACFCDSLSEEQEPCTGAGSADLMKERLWLNATCPGNNVLPAHWQDGLFIASSSHKALGDISWPSCFEDQEQPPTCQSSYNSAFASCRGACILSPAGYCQSLAQTADADCFCKSVTYDDCGGACHIFDGRINYMRWLEDTCVGVEGWEGLPENWTDILVTSDDLIPWSWRVSPSDEIGSAIKAKFTLESKCPVTFAQLYSFAGVSAVSVLLVSVFARRDVIKYISGGRIDPRSFVGLLFSGYTIAALELISNLINAIIVSNTPGYQDVPIGQLMLLWCTRPRLAWLAVVLMKVKEGRATYTSVAASLLVSEVVLQLPSAYYMGLTANYARLHKLYSRNLNGSPLQSGALIMYAGALIWLILIPFGIVGMLRSLSVVKNWLRAVHKYEHREYNRSREMQATETRSSCKRQVDREEEIGRSRQANIRGGGVEIEGCNRPGQRSAGDPRWQLENHPRVASAEGLAGCGGCNTSSRLDDERHMDDRQSEDGIQAKKLNPTLAVTVCVLMTLVWIAQWLFWIGFVELAGEGYCVPKLGTITGFWIVFSIFGIMLVASFGYRKHTAPL